MRKFFLILVKIYLGLSYVLDKVLSVVYKKCMKSCGCNVFLRPSKSDIKGLNNIRIGNNTSIPRGAVLSASVSLTIGNNVIFGPEPAIFTGNHRIDIVGRFMSDVHEKLPENDMPVTIEDDVWVGARVTILKGVTIERGCVVAAGSVVTKSLPCYSISGGIPAKVLKYRFTIDEILEHEKVLYPQEYRYTREQLENLLR